MDTAPGLDVHSDQSVTSDRCSLSVRVTGFGPTCWEWWEQYATLVLVVVVCVCGLGSAVIALT